MPKLDLTITISVILAFAAIISPIATTLLNNRHQLKLKRLELKEKRYAELVIYRRQIFENYLRCAGKFSKSANPEESAEYGEAFFLAYLYAPSELRPLMENLDDCIVKYDADGISRMLPLVTSAISVHIAALPKE